MANNYVDNDRSHDAKATSERESHSSAVLSPCSVVDELDFSFHDYAMLDVHVEMKVHPFTGHDQVDTKRFLQTLSKIVSLPILVVLRGLIEYTVVNGCSSSVTDGVLFRIYGDGRLNSSDVVVTHDHLSEAMEQCGLIYLRRVMRPLADYARRFLKVYRAVTPYLVKCFPRYRPFRTIMFDYAEGCADPPLTQSEFDALIECKSAYVRSRCPPCMSWDDHT